MAHVWTIVGGPETGKTTEALKIVHDYDLRENWAYDVMREYKYRVDHKIRCFRGQPEGWFKLLELHDFKGSQRSFISDECGDYFNHGNKFAPITAPMRHKRHNGNIYINVFHELSEVPAYVRRFTNYYLIKKSAGTPATIGKTFENYPEVIEAWNFVNSSKNPFEQVRVRNTVLKNC